MKNSIVEEALAGKVKSTYWSTPLTVAEYRVAVVEAFQNQGKLGPDVLQRGYERTMDTLVDRLHGIAYAATGNRALSGPRKRLVAFCRELTHSAGGVVRPRAPQHIGRLILVAYNILAETVQLA